MAKRVWAFVLVGGLAGWLGVGAATAQPAPGPAEADAAPAPAGDAAGPTPDANTTVTIDTPLDFGAPEVNAAASPTELRLGETITLFVGARHLPTVTVNLVEPLDLGPGLEVGRTLHARQVETDGQVRDEWQIQVTVWEIGEFAIPPIQVTYTASGQASAVATKPVPLRVLGVIDPNEPEPVARAAAGPRALTRPDWRVMAGLAIGVTLLVAALVWRWVRRRRQHVVRVAGTAVRVDLEPCAEEALRALTEVEQALALAPPPAEVSAAYVQMAATVRRYVGRHFRVLTHEATSRELGLRLEARAVDPAVRAELARWLEAADAVKFAAERPAVADAETQLARQDGADA